MESVTAVVVTYNRRELLLEALGAVFAQTVVPDRVIVVDNASIDGSAAAVRSQFPTVDLVRLRHNIGGAGGFTCGLTLAGTDLVWLMDDDTVPTPTALARLIQARGAVAEVRPALVASRVVWTDRRPHPMNTPRRRPFPGRFATAAATAAGCVPIRSASFVSVLVDAAAAAECGQPSADFFLWNDDFEFTTRLLRRRAGWQCPASVVVHKTRTFGGADADPGERFFYEVRNKIWTLRSPTALNPLERLLYGGSTLRRWTRTFTRSPDRRRLLRGLRRGLRDGVFTRPRPNGDVLGPALPLAAVPDLR